MSALFYAAVTIRLLYYAFDAAMMLVIFIERRLPFARLSWLIIRFAAATPDATIRVYVTSRLPITDDYYALY